MAEVGRALARLPSTTGAAVASLGRCRGHGRVGYFVRQAAHGGLLLLQRGLQLRLLRHERLAQVGQLLERLVLRRVGGLVLLADDVKALLD